ncbi:MULTISPECIES: hypothetical protein [Burkholderia]|uniref:hypothetical protein n=1 Tax=Burkholderia TaxID=32008 RepID=UPI001F464D26|nr:MULTISPECIES: hypothetical protein [Burkholderia]
MHALQRIVDACPLSFAALLLTAARRPIASAAGSGSRPVSRCCCPLDSDKPAAVCRLPATGPGTAFAAIDIDHARPDRPSRHSRASRTAGPGIDPMRYSTENAPGM